MTCCFPASAGDHHVIYPRQAQAARHLFRTGAGPLVLSVRLAVFAGKGRILNAASLGPTASYSLIMITVSIRAPLPELSSLSQRPGLFQQPVPGAAPRRPPDPPGYDRKNSGGPMALQPYRTAAGESGRPRRRARLRGGGSAGTMPESRAGAGIRGEEGLLPSALRGAKADAFKPPMTATV